MTLDLASLVVIALTPWLPAPSGPRQPTQEQIRSLIPKRVLCPAEIARLAQLPRQVEWPAIATEVDDEQLDEPLPNVGYKELEVLYALLSGFRQSYGKMQRSVEQVLVEVKNSEARSSYLRLEDMYSSIRLSFHALSKCFHYARRINRIRCGIQAPYRPGPDYLYEKEVSAALFQQYLATETVLEFSASQISVHDAFENLQRFYRDRQLNNLLSRRLRSINHLLDFFPEIGAYRRIIERQLDPSLCSTLARRTSRNLNAVARTHYHWATARCEARRAEGFNIDFEKLSEWKAFSASFRGLVDALEQFREYGLWKAARDRKLSPNIGAAWQGSPRLHSPSRYALAKQAVDTGQEGVPKPVIRLGHKNLRPRQKDQIQTIKARSRCYSSQDFQLTPETSEPASGFDSEGDTPRAHVSILPRKPVNAGIVERQSRRDIPQDDVSLLQEFPQSRMSAAAKRPPSHSPKGFAMRCSEFESRTSDSSTLQLRNWSYALYTGPNNENVKVHYCKNKVDTERIARLFRDEDVIGFDIEWKANAQVKDGIKQNVSLIQLASEERVALFHIARYRDDESLEDLVTPTLTAIMESPHITKVGVAIKGDCTRLHRFLGIKSRGLFELSHLYKLVKYSGGDTGSINKRLVSLATQVEEHLGLPLSKGEARTSDWSLALNLAQVQCKKHGSRG